MRLSARESQVVGLLIYGLKPWAIAIKLGIEVGTVHSHLKHARAKMGARNLIELAVKAMND